jgi:hypothetical protein
MNRFFADAVAGEAPQPNTLQPTTTAAAHTHSRPAAILLKGKQSVILV